LYAEGNMEWEAKSEWQDRTGQVGRRTCRAGWLGNAQRQRTITMPGVFSEFSRKDRMGSNSRTGTAQGKGRGRAKRKGSN